MKRAFTIPISAYDSSWHQQSAETTTVRNSAVLIYTVIKWRLTIPEDNCKYCNWNASPCTLK